MGLAIGTVAAQTVTLTSPEKAGVAPPEPWEVVRFDTDIPATIYSVREWDGLIAIEAQANESMALLVHPVSVDLSETPVLCWAWRVDAALKTANMAEKSGDDYAARVYVSLDLPSSAMSLGTRLALSLARGAHGNKVPDAALNYVWDNTHPIGTEMPNAYTDQNRMIVLQSGNKRAGKWVFEQRNILADAQAHFDTKDITVTSVAVASDTDNTQETARAGFAQVHFVGANTPCQSPQINR
ncbi:MAG: DUF3047 domain-containing protein [Pusillimonas sp.]|nr:DUF3047 domain-containing protein [Pusillimonas sp.]